MKAIYDTNNHSVFLLQYHLILVTKYKRQVIDNEICKRLKEIFEYIAIKDQYKLKIIEFITIKTTCIYSLKQNLKVKYQSS